MARRYFGTDGVRGVYGEELTGELVERIGCAFALWSRRSTCLVGRDTRSSGPALEKALARGLSAGGSNVQLGGVLPAPAISLLAEGSGAVISASHNPPEYNGVKFFGRKGKKLSDTEEEELEAFLDRPGPSKGVVSERPGCAEAYAELVRTRFGTSLSNLRVAVDCANGTNSAIAPPTFERLGATVTAIGNRPDGSNINSGCGATDLSLLRHTVDGGSFDLGIAFDGDGDRMLAVDESGESLDGDQILAILALYLDVDLVAVTSMTNMGFHQLMADRGIRVVTTEVGDRYVLEALIREGGILGGEQAGHILYLDGQTTGDGLVAGLLLCQALLASRTTLGDLGAVMPRFPQAMESVRVREKRIPALLEDSIQRIESELAGNGRIIVRASGTEPVIRVLVEAERGSDAAEACARIANLVRQELG